MKFKNYKEFLNWAYDPTTREPVHQTWPRLKLKGEIIIEDEEEIIYKSVMDVLHSHEEA